MASTSDSTPLLADSEALEAGEYNLPGDQTQDLTTTPQQKEPGVRATIILTHISAALSIIAFLFDLTAIAIGAISPHGYYIFWGLQTRLQTMFAISILTFIISSLNMARLRHSRRPLWLGVNLIVDAVAVVYTASVGPDALARNFNESPDSWLPDEGAVAIAKAVIVVLGIGLISGLLVGLVHLILFPVRCYASIKSGSWQTPQTWRIPSGEFKIEFSIKFLRQEELQEERQGSRSEGS
ncbi:uncharacterized protein BJX67DRAFT_245277 [Aspergillus lucknowensis]|uniref:Uncharacterized protein n=1 Tax=Aspergillus lucknowensis TaxID=176173 RepID=A0ABR4M1M0_9EURO